jgi:hypothetical protein
MDTNKKKAFISIDIGDPAKFSQDLADYERTTKFYNEIYQSYGWEEKKVDNCSTEEIELIEGEYSSRKLQGKLRFNKPNELRVGTLTIELYDDCPKTVANFRV